MKASFAVSSAVVVLLASAGCSSSDTSTSDGTSSSSSSGGSTTSSSGGSSGSSASSSGSTSSSSSSGSSGTKLACAPFAFSEDSSARCQTDCIFSFTPTAPAGESTLNWCSKSCTSDAQCGADGRCQGISGPTGQKGCIPPCDSDADCKMYGGWGKCRHVGLGEDRKSSYCENGPNSL